MNNSLPFILYKTDKSEFINKKCAICLCPLFYPETGKTMVSCEQLQCRHMFHTECLSGLQQNKCPECRSTINSKKCIDKSTEIAIRTEAFECGLVDEQLAEQFKTELVVLRNYPYHAPVFEKWRTIYTFAHSKCRPEE